MSSMQTVASVSLHYKDLVKCVVLVQSGHHFIECNLFSPWYIWKIAHLVLNNNQKLIYYTEYMYIPVCYLVVIYSLFCNSKLSIVCWHTICLISLDHYYGKGAMFAPMVYMSVFVSIWFFQNACTVVLFMVRKMILKTSEPI